MATTKQWPRLRFMPLFAYQTKSRNCMNQTQTPVILAVKWCHSKMVQTFLHLVILKHDPIYPNASRTFTTKPFPQWDSACGFCLCLYSVLHLLIHRCWAKLASSWKTLVAHNFGLLKCISKLSLQVFCWMFVSMFKEKMSGFKLLCFYLALLWEHCLCRMNVVVFLHFLFYGIELVWDPLESLIEFSREYKIQ